MGQLLADFLCTIAFQPEAGGGIVAPVVKGPLALRIGFDHVQARQLIVHLLDEAGLHLLLLPGSEHLAAEAVGAQCGHVVHAVLLWVNLAGNIHRGVERIAAKTAAQVSGFLRKFNHALADNGNFFLRHGSQLIPQICTSFAAQTRVVNILKRRFTFCLAQLFAAKTAATAWVSAQLWPAIMGNYRAFLAPCAIKFCDPVPISLLREIRSLNGLIIIKDQLHGAERPQSPASSLKCCDKATR